MGARRPRQYNYFRDFDPRVGRYSQVDPIGKTIQEASRFFDQHRNDAVLVGRLVQGPGGISPSLQPYSYVRAAPVSDVDPLGLWSITGDIYKGVGGGVVIGRNPDGKWFVSFRVGIGMGGGLSYDPNGSGAAADSCRCTGGNSAFGGFATTQAGLGPFFAGNSVGAGMVLNPGCGGPSLYADGQPFSYGLDAGLRFRLNASAGLEVTLY